MAPDAMTYEEAYEFLKVLDNVQVFTPDKMTVQMMQYADIDNAIANGLTIFEPSFGAGAFVCAIIQKILQQAKENNWTEEEIRQHLDTVYGIELDEFYYNMTIRNLNEMLKEFNIEHNWPHLYHQNTLYYEPDIKFDIVIGNPPYSRFLQYRPDEKEYIHQHFRFSKGNSDMYIVFFEKCLELLNDTGKLVFITPNTYLRNSSQKLFRTYLKTNNLVEKIVDYGTHTVFQEYDVYVAITVLNKNKTAQTVRYIKMQDEKTQEYTTEVNIDSLKDSGWVFPNPKDEEFLQEISRRKTALSDLCDVQHGLATNADSVYVIPQIYLKGENALESELIRPVIKASRLKRAHILFPYKWNTKEKRYEIIPEQEMMNKYPKAYAYLCANKELLGKRSMEANAPWYAYARSQGMSPTSRKRKIVIKHILSPERTTCEIITGGPLALVYSGVYITVKNNADFNKVMNILQSEDFYRYCFIVGKYMSGNYRNINTKIIKSYRI